MVLPENITCKEIANNVIEFVLCDLADLRRNSESSEQPPIRQTAEMNFTPFYLSIGKAASLFALIHHKKVAQKLVEIRQKVSESSYLLDKFIQTFSDEYYQRLDNLSHEHFHMAVLTFCGVIGAMADYFSNLNKPYLVQVCCMNLELDLLSCVTDIEQFGGWQGFYDAADHFAKEYDSKFWEIETSKDENVPEEN